MSKKLRLLGYQRRGIPCADGALPGVGHFWEVLNTTSTFSECYRKIYNANRNRSMVGFYNFTSPVLMVLESELIKTVLQTNFANFHENNSHNIDPELDPLIANNPSFNTGDKWMNTRKRLTYLFSGMRLHVLFESVKQVCEHFDGYLDKKLSKAGKVELELKELFAKFTAQVVSSAGFGIDGLCFDDNRQKESFYTIGKSVVTLSVWNKIIFTIVFFIPSLAKILKARFVPKETDHYFRTRVAEIMEQRRRAEIPKNDLLQLMVNMERTTGDKFDVDTVTSDMMVFFGGYETCSSALNFIGFNLATHSKVQENLREEIISVLNKYDGVITYEALRDMTYMDQVLNESQRAIPVAGFLDRICTKEMELKGSDGLVCRVQPGMHVLISISGLHEDSRYWENPKMFDPERFNPERKHSIKKFSFLPFSEGPRMCVGIKMAQLQIKACLATFLKKYSLELSPKTKLPLKMKAETFLDIVEGGLWAIVRPI